MANRKNRIGALIGCSVLFLVACGDAKVDASSDERMKETLAQVKATLPEEMRTEFEEALMTCPGKSEPL